MVFFIMVLKVFEGPISTNRWCCFAILRSESCVAILRLTVSCVNHQRTITSNQAYH